MSFHRGILPREGFHADVVGTLLKWTILNPLITVPAVLLGKYHEIGRELVTKHASSRSWTLATFLAGWSALRVANAWLDRRTMNNWTKDTYDWEKEVVLLTGGADGIGKAIALLFSSLKIKVVVLDVQPLTYDAPENLLYIKTDISSESALSEAATKIKSHFGREPTVLILNAGICRGKTILEGTARDVRLTFDVNAISHYTTMRKFLPTIVKENHGMVVTVASSAAWVSAPAMADYAASKAAALAFHECLTAELVTHYNAKKVRTVVVNQGYVKTKLFEGFGVKKGFVAPPMEVETLAEAVVQQVLRGESAQLILPGVYKLMAAHWRSFPNWMQHQARIGLVTMMKNWRGRQVQGLEGSEKS